MGRSWRFPSLGRDLAMFGGAVVLAAALVGAGIGHAADVLWHRHRA